MASLLRGQQVLFRRQRHVSNWIKSRNGGVPCVQQTNPFCTTKPGDKQEQEELAKKLEMFQQELKERVQRKNGNGNGNGNIETKPDDVEHESLTNETPIVECAAATVADEHTSSTSDRDYSRGGDEARNSNRKQESTFLQVTGVLLAAALIYEFIIAKQNRTARHMLEKMTQKNTSERNRDSDHLPPD